MSWKAPPPGSETATTTGAPAPKLPGRGGRAKKDRGVWDLVWPFLREQIGWIVLWFIAGAIGVAIAFSAAGALESFVDNAVIERTIPLDQAIGRVVFLTVLAAIVGVPAKLVVFRVLYHMGYRLRVWLYERLQAIDPRKMDAVASGQLMTRANADLALFEGFLLLVPVILGSLPIIIGVLIILFMRSVPMTLLVISSIPANLFIAKRMAKPLWGMSWMHLNRAAQVTTVVDEAVRGIRTVKAFGREDDERARLADAAARTYGVVMKRTKFLARWDVLLKIIPDLVNIAVLFFAARLIVGGGFTIGALVIFVRFSRVFTGIAQGLDAIINLWQYIKTAAGRIYELIFGQHRLVERGGAPIPDVADGLAMRDVTVSYGTTPVVRNLDLELRPGEFVLVQGGPGSGKSTIAALASGVVAADSGDVLLEEWDVQKLHPQKLRREVRVLNEEPFLFGRTLRENLLLGARSATGSTETPKVTDEELLDAIRAACAEEIVEELPNGLDTVLGDRGLTLSGGQRQRIGLARALVSPPRILVLDDALLAVNPSKEAEIIRRMREHAPDTSILVLTRRVGLEQVADRSVRLPGQLEVVLDQEGEGETLRKDAPYSLALASLVNSLSAGDTETGEKPPVSERDAIESDRVPTVFNLLSPIKVLFGFVAVLVLVMTALALVPNMIFRDVIDAIEAKNISRVDRDIMLSLGVGVVFAAMVFVVRIFRVRVQESINYLLRRRVFQRLTRLGVDFYDRELPGQIATRVVYDIGRVQDFVEDGPYRVVNAVLLLVGTFIVVFVWNPGVAVIALMFVPLLALISGINFPIADRINKWTRREVGRTNERLQEDFVGRYAIHTYGTQSWARSAFQQQAWQVRRAQKAGAALGAFFSEAFELVLNLAAAAILLRAGHLVVSGVLSTGTMTAMHRYVELALAPIGLLAATYSAYLVARASFAKLREPFTAPILPVDKPGARDCPELDGEIELDGVAFAYPNTKRRVLEDITLQIPAGQVVALVGPTGAGKSSIAKLVSRMYDPDVGAVRIDGADVRDYTADSYRRRLGIVPQEVFCFRGTVLSNLTYGRPDATVVDIEAAAAEVGVLESLRSIPGQWNGFVDEEGRNLTAAQRQMIGIVRAWLTDPDIVIFDEATATLDEAMEQRVLDAVAASGRTTVFITHRLAVARRAAAVVVIDEGRIVESGTHAQLLKAAGPYARLWAFGTEVDEKAMAAATGRKPRATRKAAPKKAAAGNGRRKVAAAKTKKVAATKTRTIAKNGTTKKAASKR